VSFIDGQNKKQKTNHLNHSLVLSQAIAVGCPPNG